MLSKTMDVEGDKDMLDVAVFGLAVRWYRWRFSTLGKATATATHAVRATCTHALRGSLQSLEVCLAGSIGSANWNRRSMTSDPELNAEVVDGETVKSPEGVIIGKLPRDFRIRKFVEMTRLSYDELDAMAFLEAVNQLAIAATDESTILEKMEIIHHSYFFGYYGYDSKDF
ncbi:hypothetical protein L917_19844 [Phytophthora nicotianae]|uniref:Uncharacterized protein n=1 Tax=Phytophthora nicotianae TaxID=4792 RepID=W2K338_PHYNI|nr:hypothetical protein L917_19844 [Phytophthora nicotianae]